MANSRREKELARQRAERQAARRAAAAARRKRRQVVLAGVVAAAVAVAALVALVLLNRTGDDGSPAAAAPSAPPTPSAGGCDYRTSDEPASRQTPLPPTPAAEDRELTATLTTSQGPIVLDLDTAAAPCTVNSFASLTAAGFYDDTPCHRLTTSGIRVLQCGDPTGTGQGGPGYAYDGENLEGATYPRGTVAMANAGPGTNGSQFFLVYGDSELPPDYTPFGTVTAGLDVLEKVAAGGSQPAGDGQPVLPVQITSVQVAPTPTTS